MGKNLKKALSFVLTLSMVLGLMNISAFAATSVDITFNGNGYSIVYNNDSELLSTNGNYTLDEAIDQVAGKLVSVTVSSGEDHTISMSDGNDGFTLYVTGGSVTVTDLSDDNGDNDINVSGGELKINISGKAHIESLSVSGGTCYLTDLKDGNDIDSISVSGGTMYLQHDVDCDPYLTGGTLNINSYEHLDYNEGWQVHGNGNGTLNYTDESNNYLGAYGSFGEINTSGDGYIRAAGDISVAGGSATIYPWGNDHDVTVSGGDHTIKDKTYDVTLTGGKATLTGTLQDGHYISGGSTTGGDLVLASSFKYGDSVADCAKVSGGVFNSISVANGSNNTVYSSGDLTIKTGKTGTNNVSNDVYVANGKNLTLGNGKGDGDSNTYYTFNVLSKGTEYYSHGTLTVANGAQVNLIGYDSEKTNLGGTSTYSAPLSFSKFVGQGGALSISAGQHAYYSQRHYDNGVFQYYYYQTDYDVTQATFEGDFKNVNMNGRGDSTPVTLQLSGNASFWGLTNSNDIDPNNHDVTIMGATTKLVGNAANVTVGKNGTVLGNVTVPENKTIASATVKDGGTLTIKKATTVGATDAKVTTGGVITGEAGSTLVNETDTAILVAGTFEQITGKYKQAPGKTLTVKNSSGNAENTGDGQDITVTTGNHSLTGSYNNVVVKAGTVNLSDATINSLTVENGTVTVTDVAVATTIDITAGTVTMTDVTAAELDVHGGTVKLTTDDGTSNIPTVVADDGATIIEGSTVTTTITVEDATPWSNTTPHINPAPDAADITLTLQGEATTEKVDVTAGIFKLAGSAKVEKSLDDEYTGVTVTSDKAVFLMAGGTVEIRSTATNKQDVGVLVENGAYAYLTGGTVSVKGGELSKSVFNKSATLTLGIDDENKQTPKVEISVGIAGYAVFTDGATAVTRIYDGEIVMKNGSQAIGIQAMDGSTEIMPGLCAMPVAANATGLATVYVHPVATVTGAAFAVSADAEWAIRGYGALFEACQGGVALDLNSTTPSIVSCAISQKPNNDTKPLAGGTFNGKVQVSTGTLDALMPTNYYFHTLAEKPTAAVVDYTNGTDVVDFKVESLSGFNAIADAEWELRCQMKTANGSYTLPLNVELDANSGATVAGTVVGDFHGAMNRQGTLAVTASGCTLNLNGYTLTNSDEFDTTKDLVTVTGTLTVKDSSEKKDAEGAITTPGTGTIVYDGNSTLAGGTRVIYVNGTGAALTLKSGTVTSVLATGDLKKSEAICVKNGAVTVDGGKVEGEDSAIDAKNATVKVSGGTVTGGTNGVKAENAATTISGSATVTGKTAVGVAITGAKLTVTGGTVTGKTKGVTSNNEIAISGGKVEGETAEGVDITGAKLDISGTANILGATNGVVTGAATTISGSATVTGKTAVGVAITGAKLTVTGGTVTGKTKGVTSNNEIAISGGKVEGETAEGVDITGAKLDISGTADILGATNGVVTAAATTTAISGGKIAGTANDGIVNNGTISSISGGTITGGTNGITNNATITTISGTAAITGTTNGIVNKAGAAITTISGGTIEGKNVVGLYQDGGEVTAITGGTFKGKETGYLRTSDVTDNQNNIQFVVGTAQPTFSGITTEVAGETIKDLLPNDPTYATHEYLTFVDKDGIELGHKLTEQASIIGGTTAYGDSTMTVVDGDLQGVDAAAKVAATFTLAERTYQYVWLCSEGTTTVASGMDGVKDANAFARSDYAYIVKNTQPVLTLSVADAADLIQYAFAIDSIDDILFDEYLGSVANRASGAVQYMAPVVTDGMIISSASPARTLTVSSDPVYSKGGNLGYIYKDSDGENYRETSILQAADGATPNHVDSTDSVIYVAEGNQLQLVATTEPFYALHVLNDKAPNASFSDPGTPIPTDPATGCNRYNPNGCQYKTAPLAFHADDSIIVGYCKQVGGAGEGAGAGSGTPTGGGAGGGAGAGGSLAHEVKVIKSSNGSVEASTESELNGSKVTVTVTPDAGYVLDTLKVTDANNKQLTVTKVSENKYTFIMGNTKVDISATFVKGEAPVEETPAQPSGFVDVAADAFYAAPVAWAAENGITSGADATHFAPNATTTRAQMVTFLWRAAGCPEPTTTAAFADVSAGAYYAKAVAWAVENGITNGLSAESFAPDAKVTRAQTVTFMARMAQAAAETSNSFTDVADSAYYAGAVAWAVENGITNGTSASTFSPDASCTRGQIVTFLYRYFA